MKSPIREIKGLKSKAEDYLKRLEDCEKALGRIERRFRKLKKTIKAMSEEKEGDGKGRKKRARK